MTPFEALMRSLLESSVDYVRRDVDLQAVRVTGDELTESAHIEIVLAKNSWEDQQRAIDHMIEVRDLFMGDVSFDYVFLDLDDWTRLQADKNRAQYVFAT